MPSLAEGKTLLAMPLEFYGTNSNAVGVLWYQQQCRWSFMVPTAMPLEFCEAKLLNKSCAFVQEFSSLGNAAASGANGVGTGKLHGQETYTFRYMNKSVGF